MRTIFVFNDTATTEIYTLSLHDALPISSVVCGRTSVCRLARPTASLWYGGEATHADGRGLEACASRRRLCPAPSPRADVAKALSGAVFCALGGDRPTHRVGYACASSGHMTWPGGSKLNAASVAWAT